MLVLDDYHLVDAPSVDEALAFLLDHLPPQHAPGHHYP
jgi:LuxR family maltose regulon positive regulatory protein